MLAFLAEIRSRTPAETPTAVEIGRARYVALGFIATYNNDEYQAFLQKSV